MHAFEAHIPIRAIKISEANKIDDSYESSGGSEHVAGTREPETEAIVRDL